MTFYSSHFVPDVPGAAGFCPNENPPPSGVEVLELAGAANQFIKFCKIYKDSVCRVIFTLCNFRPFSLAGAKNQL